MKKMRTNRKPFLLLLFLIGFSFLTIKIFEGRNRDMNLEVELNQPQECKNCNITSSSFTEEIIEDISDEDIVFVDQSEIANITDIEDIGSVKGIGSINCGAISADTLLASIRKTCSNTSGSVDFKDGNSSSGGSGVLVTKDSEIRIVSISYPLALFLGQSTYQDSNKQIRKDSPEYRSNGQQIDVEYVTRNLSPKESEEFTDSLSDTEKVPFKVEAEVKLGGDSTINTNTPGEYAIANADHNPGCTVNGKPCDRDFAISDFNVEKSNNLASDSKYGGYLTFQAPGGDNYEREEDNSCLAEDENYTVWDKGVVNACRQGVGATIKATFKSLFSSSQWKRCTVGEDITNPDGSISTEFGTCIDTKSIGIKMTAIFGDPYECTDDLCANAMLVDRYKSILSPNQADSVEEVSSNSNTSLTKFVATDCQISIDSKTYPVYCLWDASVYLLNYQLQAKDSAPNQEDFPENFNTYWRSVKKSSDMSSDRYGL